LFVLDNKFTLKQRQLANVMILQNVVTLQIPAWNYFLGELRYVPFWNLFPNDTCLTRNLPFMSSTPFKGFRGLLELETLPSSSCSCRSNYH